MSSISRAVRPALRGSRGVAVLARVRTCTPGRALSPLQQTARPLSTTQRRRNADHFDIADIPPTPITHLSEVEAAMQEAVSKFANDVIAPKVREMDEAENMDPAIVEQLFEQGLMGVEIPEEYGGAGMNFTSAIIGIEELARVDPSVSVLVDVHNTLVNTAIIKWGSSQLKKRFLPKLATSTVGSFCLSEPVSGSDAFALATKATKTESGYKISGSKMWITNSKEADFFIVFANLDPSKGYKGITAFIVEKDAKGFSIAKKEKKLGIKASSTCVINFDDVEIPKENLLGEEGAGYKYAIGLLNEGRIGIAAQMTGLALGSWENAVRYVWNDRKQFGQLVGEFQGMQHQIAQSYTEIAAARALVYNAARKKEAGENFVMDAAMAKLYASQVAGRVSGLAIEWMGGMGFVRDGPAEKFWRDSKIGAIYEGTSNIQLNTIAKLLQKDPHGLIAKLRRLRDSSLGIPRCLYPLRRTLSRLNNFMASTVRGIFDRCSESTSAIDGWYLWPDHDNGQRALSIGPILGSVWQIELQIPTNEDASWHDVILGTYSSHKNHSVQSLGDYEFHSVQCVSAALSCMSSTAPYTLRIKLQTRTQTPVNNTQTKGNLTESTMRGTSERKLIGLSRNLPSHY
ncbi:acyl-CoA dehydrogenase [Colletotrichum lupini]|uniref:Short/branched chain specific acyl-CoA dehydrogenase, mitochondrial n=1 Tax=Colletotrichum lupini TaxID=145971 RepID=A0A9Q8SFZ8_9PEZI|nr:acyl-CoA dehydrogenase [Colletotrichum lupini]UQC76692.1 acyl-CoA dehydrogenase [Colletotrichum lupini]